MSEQCDKCCEKEATNFVFTGVSLCDNCYQEIVNRPVCYIDNCLCGLPHPINPDSKVTE